MRKIQQKWREMRCRVGSLASKWCIWRREVGVSIFIAAWMYLRMMRVVGCKHVDGVDG